MQYLKFRFWCPAGKAFVRNHHYSGKVDELFSRSFDLLLPQQCLGIRDRHRRWIYEGDILELGKSSFLGVLQLMTDKPKEPFHVEVCRDPSLPSNFMLELTGRTSLTAVYLPLDLAKKGKIVGHIFQKPIQA